MKPMTQEWIDKAEGDWTTAMREYRARKNPNYNAVVFIRSNAPKNISKRVCKKPESHLQKLIIF
ncbi:MAG: hypothetical protein ACR2MG_20095 [Pyrinomonadaceae bacterium]